MKNGKENKPIVRKTQKERNAEWYDRVNEWLRENRLKYEKKGKNNRKRHAFTRLEDTNRKKKKKTETKPRIKEKAEFERKEDTERKMRGGSR